MAWNTIRKEIDMLGDILAVVVGLSIGGIAFGLLFLIYALIVVNSTDHRRHGSDLEKHRELPKRYQ